MKRQYAILLAFALCILSVTTATARSLNVTVYNDNRALVNEQRSLKLKKGINEIRFTNVAARIDPTSVSFLSLTDPKGTVVLEQNFEYDLVSTDKLLRKYLDEEIQILTKDGTEYYGTLLSTAGGLIIQDKKGGTTIITQNQVKEIRFPSLPEGLMTRPTLMWLVQARKSGHHDTEVAYITGGLTWHADYVFSLSPTDTNADLNGWVTVDNRAGMTFRRAHMKLVAGELHRARPQRREQVLYKAAPRVAESQVQERSLFEYHLYDIKRPVDLKNNQTKQIEFVTCKGIPVEKRYVLDSGQGYFFAVRDRQRGKVQVQLRFKNRKDAGLGIPLPAGTIRLYKEDTDGTKQLIGEDKIEHTPKDEEIVLTAGNVFDVVGERTKIAQKVLGKRARQERWKIEVRNHKDTEVSVHVVEHLRRWGEWEIVSETQEHRKIDADTIEYLLAVGPNSKASVEYTVLYQW